MNTFQVAVLRVLVKRQQPVKLSTLVTGFPDDSEDNVLSAVSSLKLQGYLVLDDYQPNGYVSINKLRRKEILQIVDADIYIRINSKLHISKKKTMSQSLETKPHVRSPQGTRSPLGLEP